MIHNVPTLGDWAGIIFLLLIFRISMFDLNSIYFALLLPLVLQIENFLKGLQISDCPFVHNTDILSQLKNKDKPLSPNQQWKMEDLLTKFNLTLKNVIIKYAINILKISLRNNINLVSKIKDKLKHSVSGAQEQNITDDIFKQGLEDFKKETSTKNMFIFDPKKVNSKSYSTEKKLHCSRYSETY